MSSSTWPVAGPVAPPARSLPTEPLPAALSRNRGGTYSSTVETIHLADGTTTRTDLIRLTPNIDTYSLDAQGVSPRRISHYREASWTHLPAQAALAPALTRILAASLPHRTLRHLTAQLRLAGYLRGREQLREHEAIAGTQAAIWRLTNGLELDTRPLDAPLRAITRTTAGAPGRPLVPGADGAVNWSTPLWAGRPAVLELEFDGAPELRGYSFTVAERGSRHPLTVRLERSADGIAWVPVSGSSVILTAGRTRPAVTRNLGAGATLASASAHAGRRGYRHYRLVAEGPADSDGLLDLRGLRLALSAPSRFRNNERVVAVYRYLLERAAPGDHDDLVQARALVGSGVPGGPGEFTPVVTLVRTRRPLHLVAPAVDAPVRSAGGGAVFAGAVAQA